MGKSSNKRAVTVSEDLILKKAYELWLIQGSNSGRSEDDWIEAKNIAKNILEEEAAISRNPLRRFASVSHRSIIWLSDSMRRIMPSSGGVRLELWVALFTFIGATVGGFLGSYLESIQWQRRVDYESRIKIRDERIKLIERTVSILSKSSRAKVISEIISIQGEGISNLAELCKALIATGKANEVENSCDLESLGKDLPGLNLELTNLTADFSTTMSLNSIFFCDETQNVIHDISSQLEWWEIPKERKQILLNSMAKELNCDFPKNR